MNPLQSAALTALAPAQARVSGLAALAFGSGASIAAMDPNGHLAFLPLESLELDLDDPEQRDFGDYELIEQLGQGGMGVVYRAHQRSLNRDVALKLLSAGPWASAEFIARFTREAQSAARLQHPNIVPIYEIGSHAELNFYSMALVQGASLAQQLHATGPFPPKHAASLLRIVAEALDYAHRLDLLHLDLKPANVLLDQRGEPQVADFGLAKRLGETLSHDSEEVSGTPSYMAPEQAQVRSHRLSAATDIYGLGAILYELLTGRPPLLGATARETLQQVVTREPDAPRLLNGTIPADLDAICMRCLAKTPADRYQTARALADDLGRFLEGRAVSVRPLNRWQRSQRWARREPKVAWSAGLALAALLAGLAATSLQWRRAEQQFLRAEQGAAQVRETLWQKRSDDAAGLLRQYRSLDTLPDLVQNLVEQEAAGATAQAELSRLRIGSVLSDAPVLVDILATGSSIQQVLLDQSAQWVAVVGSFAGGVQRFDLATGAQRWAIDREALRDMVRLVPASDGRHLLAETLNPGVLVVRGLNTHLIDLDTGALVSPPEAGFPRIYATHFSPDAAFVLVLTRPATLGDDAPRARLVRVADWQAMGVERTLDGLVLLGPGGTWFAHHDGNLRTDADAIPSPVEVFDARSMTLLWQYRSASGAALRGWRIAPDGRALALGFADGEVGLFDPDDGARRPLSSVVSAAVDDLFFSPDGRWIAASHRDGSVQVWDVASAMAVALPLYLSREHDDVVGGIDLDPSSRRIYVGGRSANLWYLPGPQQAPELLFERPAYPRAINNLANSAVIGQDLFAAGASDGEVRIWRHRSPVPLPARAPLREMRDAQRRFDGRHTLHVEGSRLQRIGLDGETAGTPMLFPQPIGFAQLSANDLVIASAGRELHVRSSIDGRPRYPPLQLPATPSALLVSSDGRRMVAAWQAYASGRSILAMRSIDVASGATLAETQLDHPRYSLQMSDDGAAVIAWRYGPLTLLDTDSLQPRWTPHSFATDDDFTPVRSARLGIDGRTLWVVTGVAGTDGYRLHALNAAMGEEIQAWSLPSWAIAIQPFADGVAVAALIPNEQQLRLFHLGGETRIVALAGLDARGYPSIALSEDEQRLAIGLRRGIQWLALPRGDWISPPLEWPLSGIEPAGVALDPSGGIALMHDSDRRQWRQDLVREQRPATELQTLARLLMPSDEDVSHAHALPRDPALRTALRADDPGPSRHAPESTPATAPNTAWQPRFVDLRPHCNLDLADALPDLHLQPRLDRMLAPGRQRLLDVDFEVQCGVVAHYAPQARASVSLGSRVEGIALARADVTAIELLLLAPTLLAKGAQEDYAILEFGYHDRSAARVPLVYGRDLLAWFDPDHRNAMPTLRVAHVGIGAQFSQLGAAGTPAPALYLLRVANPHPERPVASIALESTRHPWSEPILLAATLESAPVIAANRMENP